MPILSDAGRRYAYLFVPGFMWTRYPGYFVETVRTFQKMGLEAKLAKTKGEGGISVNGDIVAVSARVSSFAPQLVSLVLSTPLPPNLTPVVQTP